MIKIVCTPLYILLLSSGTFKMPITMPSRKQQFFTTERHSIAHCVECLGAFETTNAAGALFSIILQFSDVSLFLTPFFVIFNFVVFHNRRRNAWNYFYLIFHTYLRSFNHPAKHEIGISDDKKNVIIIISCVCV